MKKKNTKKLIIKIVLAVVLIGLLAAIWFIADGKAEKELVGIWTRTYEKSYDQNLTFELTERFILTEDRYRWALDEEKTTAALLEMYDIYLNVTNFEEEHYKAGGYESAEDFKNACVAEDIQNLKTYYLEDAGTGEWRIEEGAIFFLEDGKATEQRLPYRLEEGVLYLGEEQTALTKVQ